MSSSGRTHAVEPPLPPPVRWRVVEIDEQGSRARLSPYVDMRTLTQRLDAAFGAEGWGNRFRPFGEAAVGCELEVAGNVKAAVTRAAPAHANPEELAAAALTKAAKMHGVALPVDPDLEVWVEYDVEEQQPLYWPERADALSAGALSAGALSAGAGDAEPTAGAPAGSARAAVSAGPEGAGPPGARAAESGQPIKSEGQRAIDKLVDRLREAGHGLEAAKLVTAHKGYGNDPEAARELYARLRQLLLEGGPG